MLQEPSDKSASAAPALPVEEKTKPEDTDFRQQRLVAWQPLLTPKWVISTLLVVAAVFITIGAVLIADSDATKEQAVRYDDICGTDPTCQVTITLEEGMTAPIYFYYRLDSFFQNHRRFVNSRSDDQLADIGTDTALCDPLETYTGKTLYPCGLVANAFFNDAFDASISVPLPNGLMSQPYNITGTRLWDQERIASDADIDIKFKNAYPDPATFPSARLTRDGPRGLLPLPTDQHLMNWMKPSATSTVLNLYAIIQRDLPAGSRLIVKVANNFDMRTVRGGKKELVISTATWTGGANGFLGGAYLITGIIAGVFGLIFLAKQVVNPRVLGDMKYFKFALPSISRKSIGAGADGKEKVY